MRNAGKSTDTARDLASDCPNPIGIITDVHRQQYRIPEVRPLGYTPQGRFQCVLDVPCRTNCRSEHTLPRTIHDPLHSVAKRAVFSIESVREGHSPYQTGKRIAPIASQASTACSDPCVV